MTLCSALPSPTTALPPLLPLGNPRPQMLGEAMIRNICRRSRSWAENEEMEIGLRQLKID